MTPNIIGLLNPLLMVMMSLLFLGLWWGQKDKRYILAISIGYFALAAGIFVSNVGLSAVERWHVLGTHICYSTAITLVVWAVGNRAGKSSNTGISIALAVAVTPLLIWIHANSEWANLRVILANLVYGIIFLFGTASLWQNRHASRLDFWLFLAFFLVTSQALIRPAVVLGLEGNLANTDYLQSTYFSILNIFMAVFATLLAVALLAVCIADYYSKTLARTAKPRPPKREETNDEKIRKLEMIMSTDVHREHDLTIGKLAKIAGMQEYQLSHLINQNMGYKNFRDFLNSYRLRDVQSALSDEALDGEPITTIAFDAGFNSIPSFNRVFKSEFGVAPSAFREQKVAQRRSV